MAQTTKWDAPTRVLHAVIALLMIALFATAAGMDLFEAMFGKVAEIKLKYVHLYLGIALAASVGARVLWGFFGNDSVNWRGIPSGAAKYPGWAAAEIDFVLRGIDSDKRKKEGHNALAIPVYLAALILTLLQFATGLGMWGDLDKKARKHGVIQAGAAPSSSAFSNPVDMLIPNASAHSDHSPEQDAAQAGEPGGQKKEEESLGEEIHEAGLFWVPIFLVMHLGGIYIHYRRGERGILSGIKIAQ